MDNLKEQLSLVLGDQNLQSQIDNLSSFQEKLVNNVSALTSNSDPKIKLEATRTISGVLKNLQSILQKQREMELKNEVDFNSPKVRKGMMMLIELFFEALQELDVDPDVIGSIKSIFQLKLMGFEEKLNQELKGISASLIDEAKNPFLTKE